MNIYNQIASNRWRTWFIMFFFVVFITTIGYVFGKATGYGVSFVGIAFILSGIMTIGSYYFSDTLVLATTGARLLKKSDDPELFHIVENLSIGDGVPMPKIYMMNEEAPNAFATGRDPKHAVVCVTRGLREMMNKAELEGVLAHELSHVKNYDTRLMGVVAILVGSVAILADMFLRSLWWGGTRRDNDREGGNAQAIFLILGLIFAILSPIAATLIQLAVSRKREYLADASGVLLTRYPEGLASALEKLSKDHRPTLGATNATAHLFIENPFDNKSNKAWFAGLFDTHPPIQERIRILRSM